LSTNIIKCAIEIKKRGIPRRNERRIVSIAEQITRRSLNCRICGNQGHNALISKE